MRGGRKWGGSRWLGGRVCRVLGACLAIIFRPIASMNGIE